MHETGRQFSMLRQQVFSIYFGLVVRLDRIKLRLGLILSIRLWLRANSLGVKDLIGVERIEVIIKNECLCSIFCCLSFKKLVKPILL